MTAAAAVLAPRRHLETATPRDPAASAEPAAAWNEALRLSTAGHHVASLPWYRRARDGVREDFWELHRNYAAALFNATLEVRRARGNILPATRSSVDRVALIRASLAELAIAERLASDSRTRADVILARARNLDLWGLPLDALADYRRAESIDPGSETIRRELGALLARLRDPAAATP